MILNQTERFCDRCGREQRDVYLSPAGDQRCLFCLKFTGLRAETDRGQLPGGILRQPDERPTS